MNDIRMLLLWAELPYTGGILSLSSSPSSSASLVLETEPRALVLSCMPQPFSFFM